jgi:hypothetical protein
MTNRHSERENGSEFHLNERLGQKLITASSSNDKVHHPSKTAIDYLAAGEHAKSRLLV